jgi:hypothetical protein
MDGGHIAALVCRSYLVVAGPGLATTAMMGVGCDH